MDSGRYEYAVISRSNEFGESLEFGLRVRDTRVWLRLASLFDIHRLQLGREFLGSFKVLGEIWASPFASRVYLMVFQFESKIEIRN